MLVSIRLVDLVLSDEGFERLGHLANVGYPVVADHDGTQACQFDVFQEVEFTGGRRSPFQFVDGSHAQTVRLVDVGSVI